MLESKPCIRKLKISDYSEFLQPWLDSNAERIINVSFLNHTIILVLRSISLELKMCKVRAGT